MADDIRELVAKEIKAQAETITAGNGYTITVSSVTRPARIGLAASPADLAVIQVQGDAEALEDDDDRVIVGHTTWRQIFSLKCCRRVSDSSSDSIDEKLNEFAAAVIKGMLAGSYTYIQTIDIAGLEYEYDAEGGYESVVCNFVIYYRHLYGDPYSQ